MIIANRKFNSRLIVGTGKYKNFTQTANAIKASGADMVTVAVRRINITDKKMTRYFMTISDAANLVLISTKISNNGDCHVLKMGEQCKMG